ncbi:MAG TPA: galactokinase family protein [Candidatus Acidoferrum sp.]|nr:galactokinase family protein [Candidatus Acidoferrum sp.]
MREETVIVPGRANLIGEHIDYHNLPVLPIALRRAIRVRFTPRADRRIRAASAVYGEREFEWTARLEPAAAGDWENYVRAAAQIVVMRWGLGSGIDATVDSDLPAAAGLSSSSALLAAFTLALLRANRWRATFDELMEVLPEGEQFVGTRGGGMDHAAVLGSRAGCASLISFNPVAIRHIPIPSEWAFLVADSLVRAEKSGTVRDRYNAIRAAAVGDHARSEAARVHAAVDALERDRPERFGELLLESHASLRDCLQVSVPALDRLVNAAMTSGALGARLTGAGFGGCAIVFCLRRDLARVRAGIIERFYAGDAQHLVDAEPGAGAVHS